LTPDIPGAAADGDLLLLICRRWSGSPATPEDWTYLGGGIDGGEWSFTYYKWFETGDSDPTIASGPTYCTCVVVCVKGAHGSTVPDIQVESRYDNVGGSVPSPSTTVTSDQINVTTSGSMVLWIVSTNSGSGTADVTTCDTGTLLLNYDPTPGQDLAIYYSTGVASGDQGPATYTFDGDYNTEYGWAIAIPPAPAAADTGIVAHHGMMM